MTTATADIAPMPGPRRGGGGVLRALARVAAAVAAVVAIVVAVAAGTGWLYLLRHSHGLAIGPRLQGALPLQQLAGGDAQPLARIVLAWLPTGLALGLALSALTRLPRWGRAAVATTGAAVLLIASAAISDSIAQNEPLQAHVSGAFSLGGVWAAVALLALGVAVAP